jgi:hypothetical protein
VLTRALLVAFIALAPDASAQSVFLQGSIGSDIRRFSADPEKSAFDGTGTSIAIAAGGEFMSHWTASAELDLGRRATRSTTTALTIFGQPREIHTSYSSERRSIAALAGYRTASRRRVRVGCYAGVVFTIFRREIVSDAESIVLQSPAPGSVYEQRLTGPIVGIDLAVRAGPHVAIVPALRAQSLRIGTELGGHSIRPSVGVRVAF